MAHHLVYGRDTGSNSGGRQIIVKKPLVYRPLTKKGTCGGSKKKSKTIRVKINNHSLKNSLCYKHTTQTRLALFKLV